MSSTKEILNLQCYTGCGHIVQVPSTEQLFMEAVTLRYRCTSNMVTLTWVEGPSLAEVAKFIDGRPVAQTDSLVLEKGFALSLYLEDGTIIRLIRQISQYTAALIIGKYIQANYADNFPTSKWWEEFFLGMPSSAPLHDILEDEDFSLVNPELELTARLLADEVTNAPQVGFKDTIRLWQHQGAWALDAARMLLEKES